VIHDHDGDEDEDDEDSGLRGRHILDYEDAHPANKL